MLSTSTVVVLLSLQSILTQMHVTLETYKQNSIPYEVASVEQHDIQQLPKSTPQSLPPVFEKIADCESGGRQFDANGNVIHGIVHYADTGKFQINVSVHGERAEMLGYDLNTLEGNTGFANILYQEQGLKPWKSSKACWSL
jgi:hypothetical protein